VTLRYRRWRSLRARTRLIWVLGVLAVAAAGVLCAFLCAVDAYLHSVSAADPVQVPFSLLFLELSRYCVNAVRRHVYAADVLVRLGVDRDDSR
jgi:hypothetical protein